MDYNDLTHQILKAAYEVHSVLGPGLLESVYQKCLYQELKQMGFAVEVEKPIPVIYKSVVIDCGYRLDMLVNDKVLLELKSVEDLNSTHEAQILTYLKLTGHKVGLLINFNERSLKHGIRRFMM